MNENVYQIVPVANGYIVILPIKYRTQWDGLLEVTQTIKANEAGLPAPEKKENDSCSYVFTELKEAISFLTLKIQGEI